jgi:hypothetical protein
MICPPLLTTITHQHHHHYGHLKYEPSSNVCDINPSNLSEDKNILHSAPESEYGIWFGM